MSHIVLYLLEFNLLCFVSVSPLLVVLNQPFLQITQFFFILLVLVW